MGHSKRINAISTINLLLSREVEDIVRGDDDKFKSRNHKLSIKHLAPVDNTKQYPDDPNHYVTAQTGPKKDSAVKVDVLKTKVERKSPIQRQILPNTIENIRHDISSRVDS